MPGRHHSPTRGVPRRTSGGGSPQPTSPPPGSATLSTLTAEEARLAAEQRVRANVRGQRYDTHVRGTVFRPNTPPEHLRAPLRLAKGAKAASPRRHSPRGLTRSNDFAGSGARAVHGRTPPSQGPPSGLPSLLTPMGDESAKINYGSTTTTAAPGIGVRQGTVGRSLGAATSVWREGSRKVPKTRFDIQKVCVLEVHRKADDDELGGVYTMVQPKLANDYPVYKKTIQFPNNCCEGQQWTRTPNDKAIALFFHEPKDPDKRGWAFARWQPDVKNQHEQPPTKFIDFAPCLMKKEDRLKDLAKSWKNLEWELDLECTVTPEDDVDRNPMHKIVLWPMKMYLQYPLRYTMHLLIGRYTSWILYVTAACITFGAVWLSVDGAMNIADKPLKLDTLNLIEKAPVTKVLLAIATHLILSLYAKAQHSWFQDKKSDPPAPAIFVFMIGKFFMLFRLVLAYSSGDLGASLNFFLYEEVILIVLHIAFAVFFLSRYHSRWDHPGEVGDLMRAVIIVDVLKTLCVAILWYYYQPGPIAELFNRLPTVQSQISFFLLIHVGLDMLQSFATVFSLFIAHWVQVKFLGGEDQLDADGSPVVVESPIITQLHLSPSMPASAFAGALARRHDFKDVSAADRIRTPSNVYDNSPTKEAVGEYPTEDVPPLAPCAYLKKYSALAHTDPDSFDTVRRAFEETQATLEDKDKFNDDGDYLTCWEQFMMWNVLIVDGFWYKYIFLEGEKEPARLKKAENFHCQVYRVYGHLRPQLRMIRLVPSIAIVVGAVGFASFKAYKYFFSHGGEQ